MQSIAKASLFGHKHLVNLPVFYFAFMIRNLELSYAGLANLVGSFLPDIDIWESATTISRD